MALIDIEGDSWLQKKNWCDQLSRDVMTKVVERNNVTRGSQSHARISVELRQLFRRFSTAVNTLNADLKDANRNGELTMGEYEQRLRWVEALQSKERQMDDLITTSTHNSVAGTSTRSSLLGDQPAGSGISNLGTSTWSGEEENEETRVLSFGELQARKKRVLEEQDAGLDALSNIIGRQRQMAQTIGNEVEYQTEIIDDIGDHVDTTNQRLLGETDHIQVITRKDRTCGYWVVIILLLVVIIIIAAVPS